MSLERLCELCNGREHVNGDLLTFAGFLLPRSITDTYCGVAQPAEWCAL
jgi:hypothetical protein